MFFLIYGYPSSVRFAWATRCCAPIKSLVGNDMFSVLLVDDLMVASHPYLAVMSQKGVQLCRLDVSIDHGGGQ